MLGGYKFYPAIEFKFGKLENQGGLRGQQVEGIKAIRGDVAEGNNVGEEGKYGWFMNWKREEKGM